MKILLVDDEEYVRFTIRSIILKDFPPATILEAQDIESALSALESDDIDVVLIDMHMRKGSQDGLTLLSVVKKRFRAIPVMVTGDFSAVLVREALRSGAFDYVSKRNELTERLVVTLTQIRSRLEAEGRQRALEAENKELHDRLDYSPVPELVGSSAPMKALRATICRMAASEQAALILGPSGAGKELVARGLHFRSGSRAQHAFKAINCTSIAPTLIESELFGHERGAFTGADARKEGYFEAVGKGTLFLDEIGDLDVSLQAKLLRFLEERRYTRVGGTKSEPFLGRIVAATNADLEDLIRKKKFREDLYYRLQPLTIHVPALADHKQDIPELVRYFAATKSSHRITFSEDALALLTEMPWRGNIRELSGLVDRIIVMADDPFVTADAVIAISKQPPPTPKRTVQQFVDQVLALPDDDKLAAAERLVLQDVVSRYRTFEAAGRALGVERRTVSRRLQTGSSE